MRCIVYRSWTLWINRQKSAPKTHPSVRLAQERGPLNLHGGVYDIETGSVDARDANSRSFVALAARRSMQRSRLTGALH